MVISAGRLSTKLDFPAGRSIAESPFDPAMILFVFSPFKEIVASVVQLGMRTWYVKALSALTVVITVSLKGYSVSTCAETLLFPARVVFTARGPI